VPIWLLYLLIGLVFIPLTWWGLTVMNWVMWVTTPLYLGFLAWNYWVILTSVLGTALMFGGVFAHLTAVLTFEGVFIMGWVMAILADITISKPLGLSPKNFLYKRAHTNRFNPVGVGALALALVIALPMAFGLVGEMGKTLAPFVSGALAFIAAPLLALATRGRYYQPATVARNIDPALPPVGRAQPTTSPSPQPRKPTTPPAWSAPRLSSWPSSPCAPSTGERSARCAARRTPTARTCVRARSSYAPATLFFRPRWRSVAAGKPATHERAAHRFRSLRRRAHQPQRTDRPCPGR